jgi:hypothetical protein
VFPSFFSQQEETQETDEDVEREEDSRYLSMNMSGKVSHARGALKIHYK